MTILCTIDLLTREVSLPGDQCIAAYDHNVDVIHFQAEPVDGFDFDTSTIRIAAQGPNNVRHDYAVDPSTVQIEEETGYITFDWPIPQGVTEMPIGTFKYGDKGRLIFAVCAEIISGSTVSKAWHSDDGIITVVAHLEPESGGGEDPEEEATNAQKIAQLQTDVTVINTQVSALGSGSPTPVATVAEMTDESAVYLYTGSETGYTAGNWYFWNGSAWTSGGQYGGAVTSTTLTEHGVPADDFAVGQALAEKADADDVTALETAVESKADADDVESLTEDVADLKEELNAVGSSSVTAIAYSLTSGKIINADGTIVTAQTSFAITNKIDVTNLNSVIITTEIGYGNMLYAFYSDTDAFISGEQSAQSGYTTITDKRVDVPENADYLYVCARSSSYAVTIIGIGRFALNIEPRVEALENSLSAYPSEEVLEKIAFTEETGDYISNSGALVTQGNSYFTTGYVDISEYSEIYITGSGNYAGVIYAFYDTNKEVVLLGTTIASGSAYTTITDKKTSVPEGAKYVIVAGRFASLRPNVKYFLKYKQVGKWNGKKWVCIGDSLTEENAAASKHYFSYIADDSNVNVINMGVGGTGYKRGEGENKAFYQRIANVPTNADFVTIFGSGNDLNTTLNYDIGTYTDTGTDTLCGCINTTLDNFYDICPATPIGIIAPTPWLGWPTTTPSNRMEEYVHAMKQVCNYRGVPFLDLYHESNLRPENTANRELCFYAQSLDGNADGVHPNDLGHKIIAPKIYEFIKKLMIA